MSLYSGARLVAAALLFIAVGRHPYDYYTFMRVVVCGVTAYGAYIALQRQMKGWVWMLGGLAVLFNPIVPVQLQRSTWAVLDILAGIVMLVSIGESQFDRSPAATRKATQRTVPSGARSPENPADDAEDETPTAASETVPRSAVAVKRVISCPSCAQQLSVPLTGNPSIRCPTCRKVFRLEDTS